MEEQNQPQSTQQPVKQKMKKNVIMWGIIIIVIIVLAVVGIIMVSRDSDSNDASSTTITNTQETPTVSKEDEYKNSIATISNSVADSAYYISDLSTQKPSPLLWTEDEITELIAYTEAIETNYNSANKLSVPEKYKEFHGLFLQGLKKYAEAMPIYRQGIDQLDVDKIEETLTMMIEGNEFINQAAEVIDQLE